MYTSPQPILHNASWKPEPCTVEEALEKLAVNSIDQVYAEAVKPIIIYSGSEGRDTLCTKLVPTSGQNAMRLATFGIVSDKKTKILKYAIKSARNHVANEDFESAAIDFLVAARLDSDYVWAKKPEERIKETMEIEKEVYIPRNQHEVEQFLVSLMIGSKRVQKAINKSAQFEQIGITIVDLYTHDCKSIRIGGRYNGITNTIKEIDGVEDDQLRDGRILARIAWYRITSQIYHPTNIAECLDGKEPRLIKVGRSESELSNLLTNMLPEAETCCPCGKTIPFEECHFNWYQNFLEELNPNLSVEQLQSASNDVIRRELEKKKNVLNSELEHIKGELSALKTSNLFVASLPWEGMEEFRSDFSGSKILKGMRDAKYHSRY